MSNNFTPGGIEFFFLHALKNMGWKEIHSERESWGLLLLANKFQRFLDETDNPVDVTIYLEICLSYSKWESCFVLSKFDLRVLPGVPRDHSVLWPSYFLAHYGKKVADKRDLSSPTDEAWVIDTGRNFQSLLECYDNLARMTGAVQLFQSPERPGKAS